MATWEPNGVGPARDIVISRDPRKVVGVKGSDTFGFKHLSEHGYSIPCEVREVDGKLKAVPVNGTAIQPKK